MNKTIKKIVALGVGATMLLGTGAAAYAATLADYPAPFVQNGVFVGKIVIGENSQAIDTLGAMDIAASLQRVSSVPVSTTTGGSSAVAEDGYKFAESKDLVLGSTLGDVNPVVDDGDLPELLKSGTVEADDGSEYNYDVEIRLPTGTGTPTVSANVNNNDLNDEYSKPIVYYNLGDGVTTHFYDVYVDFEDTWSAEDFVNGETIELLGRVFTFDQKNKNSDDVLVLYGSDTTLVIGKGETKTISYNGMDYTVEVLGGNSDQSTAILRIGSDTRTVKEGDSKTIGGLPVYIKDVFVSNIGGDDVKVQLFIGSNKLELDTVTGEVKLSGKVLDEVEVSTNNNNNWTNIDYIQFRVTPRDADNEVEYILPGKDYVDPLFGSFKFHFVGAEDLMEGKELIELTQSGKKLDLVFTPRGASKESTFTLVENNGTSATDLFEGATLTNLQKDDIFLYTEYDGDPDKAVTHVLQVVRVKDGNNVASDNFEVSVKDLSFDRTYTVTKCKVLDSKVALYPVQTSDSSNVSFSLDDNSGTCVGSSVANNNATRIYTNAGAQLTLQYWNGSAYVNAGNYSALTADTGRFLVDEDAQDDDDSSTATTFYMQYTWVGGSDNAYSVTASGAGSDLGDDDDTDYYLTQFGTYVVADQNDAPYKYVRAYVPAEEVTYDMFLMPVDSTVTVTSTSGGSAVALNPISVGMAILDSEATLGSKPYIVVGGPCANTIAAQLMGNPQDCAAGFTEGKAMIKLFSDKNALLVAGYSGKDTQGASRVLANYKDYAFSGTELEVITTNLNSLSVTRIN
ncbi:MAG: hypothetical protein KatS3mg002_1118 [Candidatus Woesearchaeota archaeon]|nr:MAG: hypothetical protein KatS3mg002_1118 [Candidatus Woesearchaeota archaeon]